MSGEATRTRIVAVGTTLAILFATSGRPSALVGVPAGATPEQIRHELLRLPYYGVFDFISFKYDAGVVTLMGYAYQPNLKIDAERAVRRVNGVEAIEDGIETLPVSGNDDSLRWHAYYAIYEDPFLARYAPGAGVLWGHRSVARLFPAARSAPLSGHGAGR